MRNYWPPGSATATEPVFFDNLHQKRFFAPFRTRNSLFTGLRSRFSVWGAGSGATSPTWDKKNNLSPSKSVSALRNLFRRRKVTFSPPLLRRPLSAAVAAPPRSRSPVQFLASSRSGSPIGFGMRPASASASAGGGAGAMDWKQNISTDHTDIAYREAISRVRSILSPRSDSAQGTPMAKETPDASPPPKLRRDRFRRFFSPPRATTGTATTNALNNITSSYNRYPPAGNVDQDDLFDFIEKQSAYINQLEKEAQHSRTDLGTVLAHVKQIITENESLHDRQKQDLFSSMIRQLDDKTGTGGGSDRQQSQVIRDSRVAELDAHLNQTKRALRAAQEEILELRRAGAVGASGVKSSGVFLLDSGGADSKVEALAREKEDLLATMTRLKEQISELRDREAEATRKVKSSLEIVEQMQMEKAASDMEAKRVKDELDRHQLRLRELIQDHSRKLYEEKMQVENKYRQELDLLNNEMSQEMDSLTKSRMDLERQKRVEAELRRELGQRVANIEELRQELGMKINHLQSELQHALTQKSHSDQELCMARLAVEKAERDSRHEAGRLNAEIKELKKRAEESDSDLLRAQEVIAKLNANLQQMQHENGKARLRLEERGISVPVTAGGDGIGGNAAAGDVVLMSSLVQAMEDKHSKDMNELEQLVQVQNGLLDKLRAECKLLTDKLESTSQQYNKERQALAAEKERLTHQIRVASSRNTDLQRSLDVYKSGQAQMTERLHAMDADDKTRSDRIFQLLSKQSGLLRENQSLQNEVSLLKTKIEAHAHSLRYGEGEIHHEHGRRSGNRGIH